ncbi:hypothetical protein [Zavarzinella formosa]|uniref:hypothetical protein n=1 Tax=Zavarzinella formosa TaxID=360055 RepID=UPI000302552B|nr:hypothetical protein [Zavarzinella formosa]
MAGLFLLKEPTMTRVMDSIARLGEAYSEPSRRITAPPPTLALVTCGPPQGTLPDGTTPYHACDQLQWPKDDGTFGDIVEGWPGGWLISAGKTSLIPGKTVLAVAGPSWSPDPATVEARTMFIAAFDEGARIARIPDPATLDADGFADGFVQEWKGPANSDHQDGRAIKVQFL